MHLSLIGGDDGGGRALNEVREVPHQLLVDA